MSGLHTLLAAVLPRNESVFMVSVTVILTVGVWHFQL